MRAKNAAGSTGQACSATNGGTRWKCSAACHDACLAACLAAVAAFSLATAVGAARRARDDYPARPVTIIVPYTPGGSTEILARIVGQKLEQRLGKSVIVENKPGAGTVIGSSCVAKSDARRLHAADGDADADGDQRHGAQAAALRSGDRFRAAGDGGASAPFLLIVNPELPVNSVQGADRLRQGQSGQAVLRLGRRRRAASSLCRAVQEHDRHRR